MRKGYSEAMILNGYDRANKISEIGQINRLNNLIELISLRSIFKEREDFIERIKLAIEDIRIWY